LLISFHPSLAGGHPGDDAETAAAAGYRALDVALPRLAREPAGAVRERLERLGLRPAAAQLPVEFRRDEATFRRELAELPRLAAFAAAIGVPVLCRALPASAGAPAGERLPRLSERLRRCAAVLAEHGIALGIEPLGPLHMRREHAYELPYRLVDVAGFAASCGAGVLVDAWHWHHAGDGPADIAAVAELIVHVHLADAPDLPPEAIRDGERLLPGHGVIDLAGFAAALAAAGYDGAVTPEVHGYRSTAATALGAAREARVAAELVLEGALQ
jgi:sugar phosphate isomerase/epimerase